MRILSGFDKTLASPSKPGFVLQAADRTKSEPEDGELGRSEPHQGHVLGVEGVSGPPDVDKISNAPSLRGLVSALEKEMRP